MKQKHECPLVFWYLLLRLWYLNRSPFKSSQIVMCGTLLPPIRGFQIQMNVLHPPHTSQSPLSPKPHRYRADTHFFCCGFIESNKHGSLVPRSDRLLEEGRLSRRVCVNERWMIAAEEAWLLIITQQPQLLIHPLLIQLRVTS